MKRRTALALTALALAAAVAAYLAHRRGARRPETVPIQDGVTLDFSGGTPVVSESPAAKARMDAALRQIDESTATVTLSGTAAPSPTPAR